MASVNILDVTKCFGANEVIHNVSLDIEDGEFVILVGPSGCGKSTLLRMIAGLEEITEGHIRIGSKIVNDLSPKNRDIAMVFQNYALYPHMTVSENMGFSLKISNTPKSVINEKVTNAAEILGLTSLLDRRPGQLSGGQRQRVAMGRAIVRDPQVFLFDEPLSNLDANLRVAMRTEIKALHQRLKSTIIYVTHDQIEAMTMADKIVVMREGLLEQTGNPLDLYDNPNNLFVASFLGSPAMNLIAGSLEIVDGTVVFRSQHGSIFPVPKGTPQEFARRSATFGVRPEHLSLVGTQDADVPIEATVKVIEPTGSETQVLLDIGRDHLVGLFRERIEVNPGAPLALYPDLKRVMLFDGESGRRL